MGEKKPQPTDVATQDYVHAPKIKTIHAIGVAASVVLVMLAIILAGSLVNANSHSEEVHRRYDQCVSTSSELMIASDFLTTHCRMFVLTGERAYMDGYFEELLVTLPKARPVNKDAITAKLDYITKTVAQDAEGLPLVTVSSGIAFRGDRADANMYHEADRALYDSKHAGRDRFTVYGE